MLKISITNTIVNLDGTISEEIVEEDVSIPYEVTNFQARAALMVIGRFEDVDNAVKAQGGIALQAWEYANNITRNGALVNSLATGLGFTQEDLDLLFYQASLIEA